MKKNILKFCSNLNIMQQCCNKKMAKLTRKFIITIVSAAFLLNSANVLIYIHLAEHKSDIGGHNEDKCPVCQQAAINKTKAIIPNDVVNLDSPRITSTHIAKSQTIIKSFDFLTPHLRDPPVNA
ncbi:MAG: hypothetical protein A2Y10_04095 [Planctomycetes bacterium GWF2_41_51]|nr:MAG: hypothetical protein A2Y10_04095 [Planctomycetes bacterium GWF2_41_51]HBG26494.1 hypothetical protein [Phycisphaerales bacterium]